MRLIAPIVIVFGLTSMANLITNGSVKPTVILGTFVYGTMLFALNEINSEVATAFAWVVAITVMLTHGSTVFGSIAKGLN